MHGSHCPNCSAVVTGRFCSRCGQDNGDSLSTLDALGFDFLRKLVSTDAKLWRTVLKLFLQPGALTMAWIAGKRQTYIHPRKLYLATSIGFFIALSFGADARFLDFGRVDRDLVRTATEVVKASKEIGGTIDAHAMPVHAEAATIGRQMESKLSVLRRMDRQVLRARFSETFSRHLPKVIFFLVPVFAVIVALFFRGHRLRYVHHLAFAFHVHAFAFALGLACLAYERFGGQPRFASFALLLVLPYMVLAERRVYREALGRGALKVLGVSVVYALALAASAGALAAATLWWL